MKYSGSLKRTTPTDREIAFVRSFFAPRRLVFEALTRAELLKRWMYGSPGWSLETCEVDLKPGGPLRFVWRGPDGKAMGMSGIHREIEPPERVVHTELFDEDWTGGETVVTTVLDEDEHGTTVLTTVLYSSREARDGALRSGMEQGLAASYDRLANVLAAKPEGGAATASAPSRRGDLSTGATESDKPPGASTPGHRDSSMGGRDRNRSDGGSAPRDTWSSGELERNLRPSSSPPGQGDPSAAERERTGRSSSTSGVDDASDGKREPIPSRSGSTPRPEDSSRTARERNPDLSTGARESDKPPAPSTPPPGKRPPAARRRTPPR